MSRFGSRPDTNTDRNTNTKTDAGTDMDTIFFRLCYAFQNMTCLFSAWLSFLGEKSVLEFHASFLGQHIKTSQSRTIIAFIQRAERRVSISVAAAAKRPRNCVKHFTKVQSSWNRTIPKWGPTNGAAFRQLKLEIKSVTVFFFFLLFRVTSLTGERGSRN